MKLSERQVEAIRQSGLLKAREKKLTGAELHDAAYDVLSNGAPVVHSFTAEQDKGTYHVCIRGVPGAYFVEALEYDNHGVFDDIDSARNALMSNFAEFLVDEETGPDTA
jgi:hypothetical protein